MQVKFTILGEPKGKGRPRFSRKTGTAITPRDTVNYETLVHMEYLEQCNGFRFEDDAMLDLKNEKIFNTLVEQLQKFFTKPCITHHFVMGIFKKG